MPYFRKLNNGGWGIASSTELKQGDMVSVSLRSGSVRHAKVGELLSKMRDRYSNSGETLLYAVQTSQPAEREKVAIGDLEGVNALFDKAAKHLKKPAIVLHVGYADDECKEPVFARAYYPDPTRSKFPGFINVKDHDVETPTWYGRILKDGNFEISPRLTQEDRENAKFITEKLREFAAHPVEVATEFGKLTGRCCFCNTPLEDERSTAIGYGPTCAKNYGLPWGARPAQFAEPAYEVAGPRVVMSKRRINIKHKEAV